MSTFFRYELEHKYKAAMSDFHKYMENDQVLEAMKCLAKATKYHGQLIEGAFPPGK